jgi:hypothetical protein
MAIVADYVISYLPRACKDDVKDLPTNLTLTQPARAQLDPPHSVCWPCNNISHNQVLVILLFSNLTHTTTTASMKCMKFRLEDLGSSTFEYKGIDK